MSLIAINGIDFELNNNTERKNDDGNSEEKTEQNNACVVCEKVFCTNKRLQSHLIKKHSVRNDEPIAAKHQCDKCEKAYTTRANLLIHQRSHTGIQSTNTFDECRVLFIFFQMKLYSFNSMVLCS